MSESELVTVARAIKAFAACAPELQRSTLGLIDILTDSGSDRDDRYSAALTLHDTLFPGEQAGFAMAPRTVPRTGEKPLAFDGEILATAHSRRMGKNAPSKNWYEAAVYKTRGGSFVAAAAYKTNWAHEREFRWAAVHEAAEAAIEWLRTLQVTKPVVGYPNQSSDEYRRKQEQLLAGLQAQWDWLVGELLTKCGTNFAEVIE